MGFDYSRLRTTADRLIERFGKTAVLRKPGATGGPGYEPVRATPTFHRILLIETDSPYLAPVPYRGKTNNPSYVPYVAKLLGELRGSTSEAIGELTTRNFLQLFARTSAE